MANALIDRICANKAFQNGLKVSILVSGAGVLLILLPKKAGAIEGYQEFPKAGLDVEYLKTWVSPSSWASYVKSGFKSSPQFREVLSKGRSNALPFMGGLIIGTGVAGMTSYLLQNAVFATVNDKLTKQLTDRYNNKFYAVASKALEEIDWLRFEVVRGGVEQISLATTLNSYGPMIPADYLDKTITYYKSLPSSFYNMPAIFEALWDKN